MKLGRKLELGAWVTIYLKIKVFIDVELPYIKNYLIMKDN